MQNYNKLTKIIKDVTGRECVTCVHFGTEKCREIHNDGCATCPMFAVILNQLHMFESCIKSSEENIKPNE